MASPRKRIIWLLATLILVSLGAFVYFVHPIGVYKSVAYTALPATSVDSTQTTQAPGVPVSTTSTDASEAQIPVTHIKTPTPVKAIYLSSWVAGVPKYRDPLIKMVDDTELNAVVIDVKDSTGRISFPVNDPTLASYGSVEKRIPDIRGLINELHQKNIYVIGRVAVFQDPYMTKARPQWAITKKSDGTPWKDQKGLTYLDPANKDVYPYIVSIAHEAYADGFDEINFDYIRYPSDGNLKDIDYRLAPGKTRSDNLEDFFKYLNTNVKSPDDIPMSADLFGLTTEASDDMGIGQVWEKAYPYFDYLDPMIYPSHYAPGYDNYKNPAQYPSQVITRALAGAIKKTKAINGDVNKIRPWLQDFNLGAVYTAAMVKDQTKATYDQGLTSWLMWDPANKYTPSAFELDPNH